MYRSTGPNPQAVKTGDREAVEEHTCQQWLQATPASRGQIGGSVGIPTQFLGPPILGGVVRPTTGRQRVFLPAGCRTCGT